MYFPSKVLSILATLAVLRDGNSAWTQARIYREKLVGEHKEAVDGDEQEAAVESVPSISGEEELRASATSRTPWQEMYFMQVSLMGFKSMDGDRGEEEEEEEEVTMGEEALQGVVNGQFISAQQDGFPIVTNVSGYPEARSKMEVREGEDKSFRVLVAKKSDKGALSVGIIVKDSLPLGSCWSTMPEATGRVFYLNSRRGNLFSGQEMLFFYHYDDDPAASGGQMEASSKVPTNTLNHHGEDFVVQEGDVFVDLKSEEGSLLFAVNGLRMPHPIVGMRRALVNAAGKEEEEEVDDEEEPLPDRNHQTSESSFQLVVQMSSAGDIVRLLGE
ncbi:hypothetical protein GUITHDRAFT_102170 [Guillardia theta CCMP2712]|uniref:Uncharacterized protein n=1 Tax=Guillardia theta (strain CCMP2712) TaxID=905079 RepID=L1JW16_GUITC|nr:hypothetical protein GUITHDRAFT_102170 [Guillardia theta CCMP2712]EKX52268.1 hypothetical protein GUITHDRAFT_102170 [Guillardia theta CCMP2712]|eukprot:XP_005839248.1 hypothetical protein GUITHDRAFT_102170 [Guillardia theta CCMP2712]